MAESAPEFESRPEYSLSVRMLLYGLRKKFPAVANITCEALERMRREQLESMLCLDTRAKEEYDVSHLPGAVRVDHEQEDFHSNLDLSEVKTVVCYCSVGYRSSMAAEHLQKCLKDRAVTVYNLEGGIFQWAVEGRSLLDTSGEPTTTVHPYNSFWGHLLPANLRQSKM